MDAEAVVRTYADMIYKIAYRYVGNATDADDVFSETFLAYFKKERTFESEEHRKAWLIRVTINCAKDFLMAKGGRNDLELNEDVVGELPNDGPSDTDENILTLRDGIRALPEVQREVITLFYMQDLSTASIAEILGMTEGNVRVTLHRAREKLRRFLEG